MKQLFSLAWAGLKSRRRSTALLVTTIALAVIFLVLRGGEVILMDEPTSALDVRVSAKIQDTMDTVFAGKTRILITHDLAFARKYGRILVMEHGRLVGDGTHDALLETCEAYREMNENAGEAATV